MGRDEGRVSSSAAAAGSSSGFSRSSNSVSSCSQIEGRMSNAYVIMCVCECGRAQAAEYCTTRLQLQWQFFSNFISWAPKTRCLMNNGSKFIDWAANILTKWLMNQLTTACGNWVVDRWSQAPTRSTRCYWFLLPQTERGVGGERAKHLESRPSKANSGCTTLECDLWIYGFIEL